MPKSTNDSEVKTKSRKKKIDENVQVKEEKKKATSKSKKDTKQTKVKKETNAVKEPKKAKEPKAVKKSTTKSKATTTEKKSKTVKTSSTKASKSKKDTTKKTSTTKSRTKKSKNESVSILEYYDLPYRYNQTIVKILVQTPENLFVYWDISDDDRKNLEEAYGNDFFYNTKPVLIIHNETMNYSFEIDINDFANSWYLKISDPDCKYNIELGRRFINNNNNEYIYISSSNELITPNDHVLYNFDNPILFKNVKTNEYFSKDINSLSFIKKLYKELFPDIDLNGNNINNPSSMFF